MWQIRTDIRTDIVRSGCWCRADQPPPSPKGFCSSSIQMWTIIIKTVNWLKCFSWNNNNTHAIPSYFAILYCLYLTLQSIFSRSRSNSQMHMFAWLEGIRLLILNQIKSSQFKVLNFHFQFQNIWKVTVFAIIPYRENAEASYLARVWMLIMDVRAFPFHKIVHVLDLRLHSQTFYVVRHFQGHMFAVTSKRLDLYLS